MWRIERFSIRTVTVAIFLMIGAVAIVLSLLAGSYFRQSALDAQMHSLSRVIEVASRELLKQVRQVSFDLGMHLGHSQELVDVMRRPDEPQRQRRLAQLLEDPFTNGFVGFSNINLEKIRLYDLELNLIGESKSGRAGLQPELAPYLSKTLAQRSGVDRLKAVDALWMSSVGPLHSTLVPVGGLRQQGYLEVIINPVFNLPDIGKITNTPISIFAMDGSLLIEGDPVETDHHLPVEYIMPASTGEAAFRVVGYEDVSRLNREMERTQMITTVGFLMLTLVTLAFALWLFNRFLFVPVRRMIGDMRKMADGELDLRVNKTGLRDFSVLAETFETMANQVRRRTDDLERLLDLDEIAILCFDNDGEAIYFNQRASALFGYANGEVADLDLRDLFAEDIPAMLAQTRLLERKQLKLHTKLTGLHMNGSRIESDAIIRPLHGLGGDGGYAIVLSTAGSGHEAALREDVITTFRKSEARMDAVEQSLNSLLELARSQPGLLPCDSARGTGTADGADQKQAVREGAVSVMHAALACWERDLGRNKLDLAEASGIWPVYIDKSTPTTRTMDKYLNIESCPRNPRTQRVIDTAEFVLRQLDGKNTAERRKLQTVLEKFRLLIAGVKPT